MKSELLIGRRIAVFAVAIGAFTIAACTPPQASENPNAQDDGATAESVDVAAAMTAEAAGPEGDLMTGPPPLVEAVEIGPVVDGEASVTVRGTLPDDCTEVSGAEWARNETRFHVGLVTKRPAGACPDVVTPFEYELDIPLTGLEAGTYEVSAGDVVSDFELAEDQAPASGSESADAPVVIACAEPAPDQSRMLNLQAGFCLNFPAAYEAQRPAEGIDLISDPSVAPRPNTDEFGAVLSIETIDADGATSASLAEERLDGLGQAETGVTQTTIEVQGHTVIVADGVPGLATVRQAYIVRADTGVAHIVTVMPIDPSFPELSKEAELIWQTVIDSLRFFDPQSAE